MNDRDQIVLLRPRSEAPSLNIPLASRSILWLLPRDAGLSGPMQTLVNSYLAAVIARTERGASACHPREGDTGWNLSRTAS